MLKLSLNAQILPSALSGVLLGLAFNVQGAESPFAKTRVYVCGLVGGGFVDPLKMVLIPARHLRHQFAVGDRSGDHGSRRTEPQSGWQHRRLRPAAGSDNQHGRHCALRGRRPVGGKSQRCRAESGATADRFFCRHPRFHRRTGHSRCRHGNEGDGAPIGGIAGPEAIAILLPVDRLVDAFRTMVNVEGDIIGSLVVRKLAAAESSG